MTSPAAAVLFDRDGTLVVDVPHNGDPSRVLPMAGAVRAVAAARAAGLRVGVVTNQPGIGLGLLSAAQVAEVNARTDALFGGFDVWCVCPHAPAEGCGCRKPRPGLVRDAARRLGLDPRRTVVIGDIGSDIEAARGAGARAILVPSRDTRPEEIADAEVVALDLEHAVAMVLGRWTGARQRPISRTPVPEADRRRA